MKDKAIPGAGRNIELIFFIAPADYFNAGKVFIMLAIGIY